MPSGVVEEVQTNKQDQPKSADEMAKETTTTATTPAESNKSTTAAEGTGEAAQQQQPQQPPKKDEKSNEEGVEVVLGDERNPTVVDSPRRPNTQDQSVFRPPQPQAVRPQAMRAPSGPPPPAGSQPPYVQSSGSWGYGLPPPPPPGSSYASRPPYPVPPYNTSAASFEDAGYHPGSQHPSSHYSPPITYPGYRASEDVNVISPNHKGDPHYRPPHTPRSRNMPPPYYHYPPTSPVSRQEMMAPGTPGARRGHPAIRRGGAGGEGPYSRAQRSGEYPPPPGHEGDWSRYPVSHSPGRERPHPQVVTESSFDSEHVSRSESQSHGSHPPTPRSSHTHPQPPSVASAQDPHYQFYGGGGSWGSFDSATGTAVGPPPPHFDDQRYYGFPPDSPYGAYHPPPYSPTDIYRNDSFPGHPGVHPVYPGHPPPPHAYPYSYDDEERKGYGEKDKKGRTASKSSSKSSTNMLLPKAAEEVDFEVTDPPPEPVTPPSEKAVCESLADVNGYDVLCGRGGGTNSQIGNRRFRKLVQEFQPTYLLARRKEKPLLARSIVLIIRKRGGRFLKKDDDTGELYEVGDTKAEAKTSQALREGLDVRATKSAASSLLEKKKKKQQEEAQEAAEAAAAEATSSPKSAKGSPSRAKEEKKSPKREEAKREDSPPTLPRLQEDESKSGKPHPHSPEQYVDRKRRRTRPVNAPTDRFFPEFCPPRADLARPSSPGMEDDSSIALAATPIRRNMSRDSNDRYEEPRGCAGIAFDVMTGAATGSFCLGPTGWRR